MDCWGRWWFKVLGAPWRINLKCNHLVTVVGVDDPVAFRAKERVCDEVVTGDANHHATL